MEACSESFSSTSRSIPPVLLQKDVVASLRSLPEVSSVEEEVVTDIGYKLDAVCVFKGCKVAVEVFHPSYFLGQSRLPKGGTVLKHRQLKNLRGWNVVFVPYWEWEELGSTSSQQDYLVNLLNGATDHK